MRSVGALIVMALAVAVLAVLTACSDSATSAAREAPGQAASAVEPKLFAADLVRDRVIPYDVQNPLFTDNAIKARAIRVPVGLSGRYTPSGAFELPVGTVVMKSFGYPRADGSTHWIETRLMVREEDGAWKGYAYQWNDAHTEALRVRGGAVVPLAALGDGRPAAHVIPSEDQCSTCHGSGEGTAPIGIRADQLNRKFTYADGEEEQLVRWAALGLVRDVPALAEVPRAAAWKDPASGTTAERARGYLDGNCAHCHSETGSAKGTGLFLGRTVASPRAPGECKPRGGVYDVAPGDPEGSFLVQRLGTTDPDLMMPPVGRTIVDTEGLALVATWIRELPGACP